MHLHETVPVVITMISERLEKCQAKCVSATNHRGAFSLTWVVQLLELQQGHYIMESCRGNCVGSGTSLSPLYCQNCYFVCKDNLLDT